MEVINFFIGLAVGLVIGFLISWKINESKAKSNSKQLEATESEIKQLISQQAQQHIATTKEAVDAMQAQLGKIQEQLNGFESGLSQQANDESKDTFYGEHASVFLRNSKGLSDAERKKSASEAQPLDFSDTASGLFVGNASEEKVSKE